MSDDELRQAQVMGRNDSDELLKAEQKGSKNSQAKNEHIMAAELAADLMNNSSSIMQPGIGEQ